MNSIRDTVRDKYGAVASGDLTGEHVGVRAIASAFGYSDTDLSDIPAEANMGLSCGNPTALANLQAGETVVDLGCGGGIDVFLAAKKVGPEGRAIGIDMTPEMIGRARAAADRSGLTNVDFYLAPIERLPLESRTVDCLVSNCVLNLAEDKPVVFREMFRVLKPGGRVAVSDIALKRELPDALARDVGAYVGCVAGAITFADYERGLREAGFSEIQVVDTKKDLNAYAAVEGQSGCCSPKMDDTGCCEEKSNAPAEACCEPAHAESSSCCIPLGMTKESATVHGSLADLLKRYDINEYAASVQVYALKPL